jgi:hypothetical protein
MAGDFRVTDPAVSGTLAGMANPLLRTATDGNLSYFQRHPILKQILDDARQLTWQQIGLPALAAMGNLIISLYRDYQANRLDVSASVKPFLYSLLIGMVLYVLVAIVRAPFIVMGRHHQQIANLNQRVVEVENRPLPIPALLALPATPNLKLRRVSVVSVKTEIKDQIFGSPDRTLNEYDGQEQRDGYAAVLEFVNDPTAGSVAEIARAKAILTYRETGGDHSLDVGSGVWLGLSSEYVPFEVGHSERLIVAVQLSETGGWPTTYEYQLEPEADGGLGWESAPLERRLEGAAYRIKVQIVNRVNVQKRGIETVGKGELLGEYFFRLTTSPFGLIADDETN